MSQNVLHLCHSYNPPFLSVARQYGLLFKNTDYRLITVFLKGDPDEEVRREAAAHEVIFLQNETKDLRGLKRAQIQQIRELHQQYEFVFAVAHRYKAIFITSHLPGLQVLGIHHIDGVYRPFFRRLYVRRHRSQLTLLGVSKAIRDDIRQSLPGFPPDRTNYLYNSLEFEDVRRDQLQPDKARHHLGLPSDAFVFGNIGRLHADKDQATLINGFADAASGMPGAILAIAGEGPLKSDLEAQARELGIGDRVVFLGMVPEVFRFVKAFDSFVLSSIREGLPVALLEAFAADRICIASLCNGNAEAIEGCGLSFPVGDADALRGCFQSVFRMSAEERGKLVTAVRRKIEGNFTVEAVRDHFWSQVVPPVLDRIAGRR